MIENSPTEYDSLINTNYRTKNADQIYKHWKTSTGKYDKPSWLDNFLEWVFMEWSNFILFFSCSSCLFDRMKINSMSVVLIVTDSYNFDIWKKTPHTQAHGLNLFTHCIWVWDTKWLTNFTIKECAELKNSIYTQISIDQAIFDRCYPFKVILRRLLYLHNTLEKKTKIKTKI